LISKELKLQLRSITLYIFFAISFLFYLTQFNPPNINVPIEPIDEMHFMYQQMKSDYKSWITLDSEQKAYFKSVIEKMHQGGLDKTEPITKIIFDVNYQEYDKLLEQLNTKLGGKTYYGKQLREAYLKGNYNNDNSTYEQRKKNFDLLLQNQSVTQPYGRVFADYLGLTAGILPLFLSAFVLTRDKRNQMHELIYSRNISSFTYVISKFIAVSFLVLICYLLLATHTTIVFAKLGSFYGYSIDCFAFYKYTFAWVLPTILFSTALSMLLSIAFGNGIIAMPVQLVIWLLCLSPLLGDYKFFKPIIRYNLLTTYNEYSSWSMSICANRIFIFAVSILIIFAASKVLSLKRTNKKIYNL
jgi:ABC-type transport system involved in multi-copper enzyme maturation permease subunit